MQSFRDLSRHFGALPPGLVNLLTTISEARGRQDAFRRQRPGGLETLRSMALIQSTEASNAIENIRAPHARIEALVREKTAPRNRSEQEIAGYRFVLDQVHANAPNIPFEPRYVEQLHGYLYRFTGDRAAGRWKRIDNKVEELRPGGMVVERFRPVSADDTPAAMAELHDGFGRSSAANTYHHLLLASAYLLDFSVIHPFPDGNGRMSRLITLWLLYLGEYEVGRYISLEKLIDESRETYYEALGRSTAGWHEGRHDLRPWTEYFLGVVTAACQQFENRTQLISGRGSKRMLIHAFIRSSVSGDFAIADIREAAPGVSDAYIGQVLSDLKQKGVVEARGSGRGARWKRLLQDF